MNVNELMIGDWVRFPNSIDKVQEISYVCGKGYCASFAASTTLFPISIDKIKPIPLTPEILEKNGFVYDSKDKLFEDIYPRISMLYAQYRLVENGGINYGEISEIKYVHQLQHALGLCGIEKEIIL